MTKLMKIVKVLVYSGAAVWWEFVRLLWYLWNRTYLVIPRMHSQFEVYFMMWLCQWPSIAGVRELVDDINTDEER